MIMQRQVFEALKNAVSVLTEQSSLDTSTGESGLSCLSCAVNHV